MNDSLRGLEPRLQEYLYKKNYYKKYNINANYIEKEHSITDIDLLNIKNYLKDPYNYTPSTEDFITKRENISKKETIVDERLKKITDKQEKERNASFFRNYNVNNLMNNPYNTFITGSPSIWTDKAEENKRNIDDRFLVENGYNTILGYNDCSYGFLNEESKIKRNCEYDKLIKQKLGNSFIRDSSEDCYRRNLNNYSNIDKNTFNSNSRI